MFLRRISNPTSTASPKVNATVATRKWLIFAQSKGFVAMQHESRLLISATLSCADSRLMLHRPVPAARKLSPGHLCTTAPRRSAFAKEDRTSADSGWAKTLGQRVPKSKPRDMLRAHVWIREVRQSNFTWSLRRHRAAAALFRPRGAAVTDEQRRLPGKCTASLAFGPWHHCRVGDIPVAAFALQALSHAAPEREEDPTGRREP